jgi:hypothetical protein
MGCGLFGVRVVSRTSVEDLSDLGIIEGSRTSIDHYERRMKMKEWLIFWFIGLVMMTGGGYFGYVTLLDVVEHVRRYKEEKENKEALRLWYLDWLFILLDAFIGTLTRPAVVTSLLFFVAGTVIFVLYTIRIAAKLFGYDLVF